MGSICCKPSAIEDSKESPRERLSRRAPSEACASRIPSLRREDGGRGKDRRNEGSNDEKVMLIDKQVNGVVDLNGEIFEPQPEKADIVVAHPSPHSHHHHHHPGSGRIPKSIEGEQVAAGWPTWLAAIAGDAIKGWVPRHADSFEKLDKIGQGTYSNVYGARDLEQRKIVALKKVRFDSMEPESVRFMAREIHILRRLEHPNIIKLEGLVTSRMSSSLYLVFEYMEHDLAGLASHPAVKFTEPQKRQAQCNSKSRSEKFSSHQEEVASAFPIEPPRVSQAMEESGVNGQGHPYKRASHSGLLVHQRAWSKGGKNLDDAPTSGPLSTRSMLSEDNRDKSGSLRRVAPKLVARFPGSFKETSASINGQDQMHHLQGLGSSHQNEGPSISTKDPVVIGCESKGKKIHYSGPLVVPSGNVDQILKDHDHQVQEAVRRARIDEARLRKMQAERSQPSTTLVSDTGL